MRVLLIIWLGFLVGCQPLREEFYRGEIKYLHTEANKAYKAGDYEVAKKYLETILEYAPDYEPASQSLANISLAQGDAEKAEVQFNEIIKRSPEKKEKIRPYLAYAKSVPRAVGEGQPDMKELAGVFQVQNRAKLIKSLQASLKAIEDMRDWISRQRVSQNKDTLAVDKGLLQLIDNERIEDCKRCMEFSVHWFINSAGLEFVPLYTSWVQAGHDDKRWLYKLASLHERYGSRAEAIQIYQGMLPDQIAKEKLRLSR